MFPFLEIVNFSRNLLESEIFKSRLTHAPYLTNPASPNSLAASL